MGETDDFLSLLGNKIPNNSQNPKLKSSMGGRNSPLYHQEDGMVRMYNSSALNHKPHHESNLSFQN